MHDNTPGASGDPHRKARRGKSLRRKRVGKRQAHSNRTLPIFWESTGGRSQGGTGPLPEILQGIREYPYVKPRRTTRATRNDQGDQAPGDAA